MSTPVTSDYKVNCEIHENAAPQDLLFLHGNIASNRWWYPAKSELSNIFTTQAKSLNGRMVFAELRGCGQSPALPDGYVMKYDDMVNDFISIAETHGLKNVVIVGHSTGGLIGSLMMARRPDLFKGAVLIDPVGPKGIVFGDDLYEKYQMMMTNRELTSQIIGATIYKNDFNSDFFKTVIVEDTVQSLQKAGIQIVRALRGIDVTEEIKQIQQPVIIFHGQQDWVLEESHATDLQALMQNAEFVNLPENGHCLNVENPKRLAQEISKFLESAVLQKMSMKTAVQSAMSTVNH